MKLTYSTTWLKTVQADHEVSRGGVMLGATLASHATSTGMNCRPSIALLATEMRCSERTAWNHLAELVELKYVVKGGPRDKNRFLFDFPQERKHFIPEHGVRNYPVALEPLLRKARLRYETVTSVSMKLSPAATEGVSSAKGVKYEDLEREKAEIASQNNADSTKPLLPDELEDLARQTLGVAEHAAANAATASSIAALIASKSYRLPPDEYELEPAYDFED